MSVNEKQYKIVVTTGGVDNKPTEATIQDVLSVLSSNGIDYVTQENINIFLLMGGVLLLAQDQDKIIGCLGIITDGIHVHIMLMAIRSDYKKTNVANMMVKNAEKLIRDNLKKYDKILLWDNANSQNMIQIFNSKYDDYVMPVKVYFKKIKR